MTVRNIQISLVLMLCMALILVAAVPVWGEIFVHVDSEGVWHFTNAPTSSKYKKFKHYPREIKPYPRVSKTKSGNNYSATRFDGLITEAAKRHGIAFSLLKAIIRAESGFNPRAVSKKGATGLMQIMPDNFKPLDIQDPFDPRENIMAGTKYFKQMLLRYKGKLQLSLAAYNAGPNNVDRYNGIPLFPETEDYVRKVMNFYWSYKRG